MKHFDNLIFREKLKNEQQNHEMLSSLETKDREIASLQAVSIVLVSSLDLIRCVYHFQYNMWAILKAIRAGVSLGLGLRLVLSMIS